MEFEPVVVTGVGTVSSVGIGKDDFWAGIIAGKSGVKPVTLIAEKYMSACRIGAEITGFDPLKYVEPKQAKRMDRFIQFAVAGSKLALADAKLDMSEEDAERVGVIIGSAAGGFATIEAQTQTMFEKGPGRISPLTVPMLIVNMAAGWVSIVHIIDDLLLSSDIVINPHIINPTLK